MAGIAKAADAAAFGFKTIYGEGIIMSASRVRYIISAATNRAAVPGIYNIKSEWRIHTNGGVQGTGWLPGPVTDAANILAFYAGGG